MVALLDMQGMTPASGKDCHGHEAESGLSVTLCFSFASFTFCV